MNAVKFLIMFHRPEPAAIPRFEEGYTAFLGMVEQIPNIQRRQVTDIMGSPEGQSPYYRMIELYFADKPTMTAALNSEAGQRAGAALYQVFKPYNYRFETLFADVYEEEGGQTPPITPTTGDNPTP